MNDAREDEVLARHFVEIMGDSSAAAQALRELEKRRLAGKESFLILKGDLWVVGTGNPGNDILG